MSAFSEVSGFSEIEKMEQRNAALERHCDELQDKLRAREQRIAALEARIAELKVLLRGANERAQIMFDQKNMWMERANREGARRQTGGVMITKDRHGTATTMTINDFIEQGGEIERLRRQLRERDQRIAALERERALIADAARASGFADSQLAECITTLRQWWTVGNYKREQELEQRIAALEAERDAVKEHAIRLENGIKVLDNARGEWLKELSEAKNQMHEQRRRAVAARRAAAARLRAVKRMKRLAREALESMPSKDQGDWV